MSNLVDLPTPIEEVRPPLVYTKVLISVVAIELSSSATIQAYLTGESGESKNVLLVMSGDDYSAWGGDDQYVVDWVLRKLGE